MVNPITLQWVCAGHAIFTLDNGTKHYTYQITKSKPSERYPNPAFFAALLTGPDNTDDYTYIGMFEPDANDIARGFLRLTAKSRYSDDSEPVKGFRWAIRQIVAQSPLPLGWTIQHAGYCCRCGKLLTVPKSIETGIGPECAKLAKLGG